MLVLSIGADGGLENKFVDGTEAVRQMINNRLQMISGQWFLDTTIGLGIPQILYNTTEQVINEVMSNIALTDGVSQEKDAITLTSIVDYKNTYSRDLTLDFFVKTIYNTTINISV